MIKGDFIEDMEYIQELYKNRFVKYSADYNFLGISKAKAKMQNYKNCVEKMEKLMRIINND